MAEIIIARDFTDTPGGRYIKEGNYSGELFRDTILLNKYQEALSKKEKLIIDFDGCYGFASSFLEEVFGGFVRNYNFPHFREDIKIISHDDPSIPEKVIGFILSVENYKYFGTNTFNSLDYIKMTTKNRVLQFNENSYLSKYLKENKNWREELLSMGITFKECGNYCIFNYTIGANFFDPIVQEARGIILDLTTLGVVCFPFRKFGKYSEEYCDEIDWKTATVYQKLDGSIIKLWFDWYQNKWVWSTNSTIYAEDAFCNYDKTRTFMDLIKETSLYKLMKESLLNHEKIVDWYLDKELTYIFELCTPENTVVIHHNTYELYHIGTRNNYSGIEYVARGSLISLHGDEPLYPKVYKLSNLDDCIEFASTVLNFTSEDNVYKICSCEDEGFVVVDKYFHRIKVKSFIYQVIHNIVTGSEVSKKLLLELIHEKNLNIDSLCENYPEKAHWFRYYSYKYTEFVREVTSFINITRKIYEITGDRKEVANRIKGHKYSPFAFKALDNNLTLFEIMDKMNGGVQFVLNKYIDNYEPENYGYLFDDLNQ